MAFISAFILLSHLSIQRLFRQLSGVYPQLSGGDITTCDVLSASLNVPRSKIRLCATVRLSTLPCQNLPSSSLPLSLPVF